MDRKADKRGASSERKLALEYVPLDKLVLNDKNPRKTRDLAVLERSFEQYGFANPIIAYRDGDKLRIAAGHHRYAAAKAKGLAEVPVVIVPWFDEKQARGFGIMDNRTSEVVSEWDAGMLQQEIATLLADMPEFSLDMVGFDDATLAMCGAVPDGDPAEPTNGGAPEAPPLAPPQIGDLKGVAPNLRVPLVYYADTQEQATRLRTAFAHPKRQHELNCALLIAMLDWFEANQADTLAKLRADAT